MKTYRKCRSCQIRWVQHDQLCARCARELGVGLSGGRPVGRPRKEPEPVMLTCDLPPRTVLPREVVDDGVLFEVVWPRT